MSDRFKSRTIRTNSHRNPTDPNPAIIASSTWRVFCQMWGTAGVGTTRPQRPSRFVSHRMSASIPNIKIPVSIWTNFDAVQAMIVIQSAETSQENLFSIDFGIKNRVPIHIGVDQDIG